MVANTWLSDGDFYVSVWGRKGACAPAAAYEFTVTMLTGACGPVTPIPHVNGTPLMPSTYAASPPQGGQPYKTLILTDLSRMTFSDAAERQSLVDALDALAARPEVNGVVVDVALDPWVAFFNLQADQNWGCPYAKNLVADAIKGIVLRSRDSNHDANGLETIEYLVIVGNDEVIPFFRQPDESLLGPERKYAPPVREPTSSQASLRLNYVLSQDDYGSRCHVRLGSSDYALPDLAVGRLVETPANIMAVIDAYLDEATSGVIPEPTSALVTGYDFLADAAEAVRTHLNACINGSSDALIADPTWAPSDPRSWTAADLRPLLLENRHDLIFLAGHFSGNSLAAADSATGIRALELAQSPVKLVNAIVFSTGCHSGYNIVNEHDVPGVTKEPDWASAFASHGATLVAGTGYQYGDTEFLEYCERLYREFARQLRTGTDPVPVGKALVDAKRQYLAETPLIRGAHEKTLREIVLYGLPMLSVDIPNLPVGRRLPATSDSPIPLSLAAYGTDPGDYLGLEYANVTITPTLTQSEPLKATVYPATEPPTYVYLTYLSGGDGVVTVPVEPVLPLEVRNVTVPGKTLRGVGFRGGSYQDSSGVRPLTGAPNTELRGVHVPFLVDVFYPVQPWSVNYFDALCGGVSGQTRLNVFPAQFKSDPVGSETGIRRKYTAMNFRLFYSANATTYGTGADQSTPALSGPPDISDVSATYDSSNGGAVQFQAAVVGNPAAGVQEVWVTCTSGANQPSGEWRSFDLVQQTADETGSVVTEDTRLWKLSVPLSQLPVISASDLRFMVQAVNGVGLVAMNTGGGAYYGVTQEDTTPAPTTLTIDNVPLPPLPYGSQNVTFGASLSSANNGIADQTVVFTLGSQSRAAVTDASGKAWVTMSILELPGGYPLQAAFAGTAQYAPSTDEAQVTIMKQITTLHVEVYGSWPSAVLVDGTDRTLSERTVLFEVEDTGGNPVMSDAAITDHSGRAVLTDVNLDGNYVVTAYFPDKTDGPLVLSDPCYEPCFASGTLTLGTDTTAPTINCPADMTVNADGGVCGARVEFDVAVSSPLPGDTVVADPPSGSFFPLGTTPVTCLGKDAAGNRSEPSCFSVTVENPNPSVTITGPASGALFAVNTPVVFTATFSDEGGGTHAGTWTLDGISQSAVVSENETCTSGSASAKYSFPSAGVYMVQLTITDSCGGSGSADKILGLDAMVVIYDPSAGFVTGGGWINSPAGAYTPDLTLAGKANFGFVSKYKKGAPAPTGETEFNFHVANMKFNSTSYEWLVVSGARAQYKGVGTINGAGNYGFLLTAIDGQLKGGGGTDKFRMKIWRLSDGGIVYNNEMSVPDGADPTAVIGGGSIVIHK
jgi:hypothetical protein